MIADAEEPGHGELADDKVGRAPDQVVGGHVERLAVEGVHPEHVLDPVGLDRDDPGRAVGVVNLGANRVALDQASDRHRTLRGADQRVVRLAGRHLLRRRGPDVEPDRRVEAEHLVDQRIGELVVEDLGVGVGGEVAVLTPGRRVGPDHPVDELLQAPLTLRRPHGAAEILGRDDVGGVDRPEIGELHAPLLEVDRPVPPVGHDNVAALPGDLVIGMNAVAGVDAADGQALARSGAVLSRPASRCLGHLLPLQGSVWFRRGPYQPPWFR